MASVGKRWKGMYFQTVETRALPTRGQVDVNLHHLTAWYLLPAVCPRVPRAAHGTPWETTFAFSVERRSPPPVIGEAELTHSPGGEQTRVE